MHSELTVARNTNSAVENNQSIGKSASSRLESPNYAPMAFDSAEVFGGGFEYFAFQRLSLWPSMLIRVFEQEEE